ncbi:hypothetical protein [Microvirga makkahensis]|uniref:Uncharacterized protein n=1 Tax=Microvirga makkahensis TaxID=1128670 RepID=A0A7X3MRW4_9HYPH|nr:hypothetical protein [Microvirga makkahensis]MXQ12016.1 hypothetical protein [Microvirga makkahensis]
MFFRRKPKPSLAQVETLTQEAVALVDEDWRDKDYRSSQADLKTFLRLKRML